MAAELSLMRLTTGSFLFAALSVAVLLFLPACSNPDAQLNEKLCNEIILVHDQAMEQTGYLFDLQIQLEQIDASSHIDRKRAEQLIAALKNADREMFSWMNQYQTLAVNDDIGIDNDYRKKQLRAIQSVNQTTDKAILDAREFLALTDNPSVH